MNSNEPRRETEPAGRRELGMFWLCLVSSVLLFVGSLTELPTMVLLLAVIGLVVGVVVLVTLSVARARRSGVSTLKALRQAVVGGLRLLFNLLP